jgi:hypothetical protein
VSHVPPTSSSSTLYYFYYLHMRNSFKLCHAAAGIIKHTPLWILVSYANITHITNVNSEVVMAILRYYSNSVCILWGKPSKSHQISQFLNVQWKAVYCLISDRHKPAHRTLYTKLGL